MLLSSLWKIEHWNERDDTWKSKISQSYEEEKNGKQYKHACNTHSRVRYSVCCLCTVHVCLCSLREHQIVLDKMFLVCLVFDRFGFEIQLKNE